MAPRRPPTRGRTPSVPATPNRRSGRIRGEPAPLQTLNPDLVLSSRRSPVRRTIRRPTSPPAPITLPPRSHLTLTPTGSRRVEAAETRAFHAVPIRRPSVRATPSSPPPAQSTGRHRHHQVQAKAQAYGGYVDSQSDSESDSDSVHRVVEEPVEIKSSPESEDGPDVADNQAVDSDTDIDVERTNNSDASGPTERQDSDGPQESNNNEPVDGVDRRRSVAVSFYVQRRNDAHPQLIKLRFYDDWQCLQKDEIISINFSPSSVAATAHPIPPQSATARRSGSRLTGQLPAQASPDDAMDAPSAASRHGARKRGRDAVEESGDARERAGEHDVAVAGPAHPTKRRRSHEEHERPEEQGDAPFLDEDEPVADYALHLGRILLYPHTRAEHFNDHQVPQHRQSKIGFRKMVSGLKSLCHSIGHSFGRLSALVTTSFDLTAGALVRMISKAFQIIRSVPGRPISAAGLVIALAIAIYIARSPGAINPQFVELDAFEETDLILQLYSSIPSVLLFGNSNMLDVLKSEYNFELQTGSEDSNSTSLQLAPSSWELGTTATYAPETVFLDGINLALGKFFANESLSVAKWVLDPDYPLCMPDEDIPLTPYRARARKPSCARYVVPDHLDASTKALKRRVVNSLSQFRNEHELLMDRMRRFEQNSMQTVHHHLSSRQKVLQIMNHGGANKLKLIAPRGGIGQAVDALLAHGPWQKLHFALDQRQNATAQDLLAVLECHLSPLPLLRGQCAKFPLPPRDDYSTFLPPYMAKMEAFNTNLREVLAELHHIGRRFRAGAPTVPPSCNHMDTSATCLGACALREIEVMADFLQSSAIPRLNHMRNKVSISLKVFGDAERRRTDLLNELEPITGPCQLNQWIDWLKLRDLGFKMPIFPSLQVLAEETDQVIDRVSQIHNSFKARNMTLAKLEESSGSGNNSDISFNDCILECVPNCGPISELERNEPVFRPQPKPWTGFLNFLRWTRGEY